MVCIKREPPLDFTLDKYRVLCHTLQTNGYTPLTVRDFLNKKSIRSPAPETRIVILRHDVDRKITNALRMANLEHELGIHSTYYFRYPSTFKPEIVREIEGLGHEIGYHYEVLSKAKGNPKKAIRFFEQELSAMREVCDIKTICMHGSPLSRYDNRDLWKTYKFSSYNIVGEAFLSMHDSLYFTDTGRNWDNRNNLRDKNASFNHVVGIKTTNDLLEFIHYKKPLFLYLTIHPERWAGTLMDYYSGCFLDFAINCGKRVLSRVLK